MNTAADVLADLRRRGLHLQAQDGELVVRPRSALTDELRSLIRAHKPELLRALVPLPADLERRLRLMAQRWQYTDAEVSEALERARLDPAGWIRAVELDEEREPTLRQGGQPMQVNG